MDYKLLRENMVRDQLIPRGIKSGSLLEAFRRVERHLFVPDEFLKNAYGDHPLPIGNGQTISQPFIAALMTELLRLEGGEKVLEIGTGSGYQTAILAELAKSVYSVERVAALAERAKTILSGLGYKNVDIDIKDGSLGWPEHAPYDAIIITASCPGRPAALLAQLKEGGRLVAPVEAAFGQILTLFANQKGNIVENEICGCMFVPLIGKEGWKR